MKVVILAGGRGSTLSDSTDVLPKPMVEIGGRPLLWHIMQHYAHFGFKDFVLALGYRSEHIKRYLVDFGRLNSDLTVRLSTGDVLRHTSDKQMDWTVELVDTGIETQTGGRLKRLASHLNGGTFMMAYGDAVCDLNISDLVAQHKKAGKVATITAVRPPARFGNMHFEGDLITKFTEKPQTEGGWINGGFFVLEPEILEHIDGDTTWIEREPMDWCATNKQLRAHKHDGFWQCMDTLRDRRNLEELVAAGKAPWLHEIA